MLGLVSTEVGGVSEGEGADLTLVGAVASVGAGMHLEAVGVREALAALLAPVGLLPSVSPQVGLEAV